MIANWMSRTQLLLGDEKLETLIHKNVLVVGLGGVGGICAEMIARSGVGKITLVDADVVDISNGNRQIPALHSTVGLLKAEVMAARIKDINPAAEVIVKNIFITEENIPTLVLEYAYDFVVDCIDTLTPKTQLIKFCKENSIPIATSLGAGGKTNPNMAEIVDISKTHTCTLAKYVRKRLHEYGIYEGLPVVYSAEVIDASKVIVSEKAKPKKTLIGTISYMPAIFGCMMASIVIRSLMGEEKL
jgi:tRNA threonylcarbamoyladenosine dehydratase